MENSWQTKRGRQHFLPPPPPTPPAPVASSSLHSHTQFSNADCRLYYQPIQDSIVMTPDHMLSNMHGLDNMGHCELGASFLSLISGPMYHMPCDQQRLLDPNAVPVSDQLPLSCGTTHGFSGGNRISVMPGVPWSQDADRPNLTSEELFSPLTLFNSNVNCSNNSQILQAVSLDVQNSQAVAFQTSHDKDKATSSNLPFANTTTSTRVEKYHRMTASQKVPGESNTSASDSFLRVSCSGISGNLHLNNAGLLGVVCTCHGLYMSISKFSEHSGSHDDDPGNAVCMDTGETLAHWWKAFSSRTGIRVVEGHKGWDWPEGISVAFSLANQPISSMSNIPIPLNQVSSFTASVSNEQKSQSVILSKDNQSRRSIVDECLYHERDRPPREHINSLFKYFTNSSHENLPHTVGHHLRGLPNSYSVQSEKASQSVAPALDIICESANSLPAVSNLQDSKTSCNGFSDDTENSLNVERLGVSSSFELRLGQPPEKSRTLETKHQLPIDSNLNGVHEEPSKVFFQDKLLHTSNVWQGSRSILQYGDIYSSPPERRGPTELERSRCVGGAYGSTTNFWKDASNISLETDSIYRKLLSGFRNPATKCQLRNNYENDSDGHVGEKSYYDSKASESDKISLPWNSLAGAFKEVGMNASTAPSKINDDREVEFDLNGLLAAAKGDIEISKGSKGKTSNFNLVLGESSTACQIKSLDAPHMSTMTVDRLYGRGFLNNSWKITSCSDITHFNHDNRKHVKNPIVSEETPPEFSFKYSVSVCNSAPTLPKEMSPVIKNGLQYRNVEVPAAWNMLGISDRENGPPVRSVLGRDIIRKPHVQSPVTIAPSISEDPAKLLDSLKMPNFLEMGDKSTLPSCWLGHNCQRFHAMTGRSLYTDDSVLPHAEQLSLRPRGTECNSNKEHSSQGLPYAFVPETCSSTAQEKHLSGKNDLNDGTFCNFLKGDRIGAAARVLHSKLRENCPFLKETAKSFDRAESLVAPNIKSAESCSFQWRDVPKKVKENCSLTRKEQEAGSRSPLGFSAADVAKFFTGFPQIAVPLKEQEVSNISSGCSAPDVTQSSSEVNKKDSSTTEVKNISFADSIVLNKTSGNGRSCSSDDGLDSEFCPEFYGSASKINFIKREPFKLVPRKQSRSLIEEIRLQNSLQSKSSPYKTKRSYTFCDDSDYLQKCEPAPKKKRKTVKWMKLDVSGQTSFDNKTPKFSEEVVQNANSFLDMQMQPGCDQGSPSNCEDSFEQSDKQMNSAFSAAKWVFRGKDLKRVRPQGEQQKTEANKSVAVDGALKASEMFRKKSLRLDDAFARRSEVRGVFYSSDELTAKVTSLGSCSNSFGKSNFQKRIVRPTVCGKYGIISNGNPSKATKIMLLSEVLKTVVSLAGKGDKKAENGNRLKSTSVNVMISGRHAKQTALGKKVLKSRVQKFGTHSQLVELESSENDELDTASCSETTRSDYPSYALQKCGNHGMADKKPEHKLKTKLKEGRQRSLHELLFKGSNSEVVNSSFMKNSSSSHRTTSRCCGKGMANDVDDAAQASEMNKATGCSAKHQRENSDMFCCVCGGSDKYEHNQLLQCNRFLLKGLRDEAEAVDNKSDSFNRRCNPHAASPITVPDSDSDEPGDKLICARTEGYKGRKQEGFLHNHSRMTKRNSGCLVPQEQLNAWLHIHQQKPHRKGRPRLSTNTVEPDCRKAYTRYKQSESWKQLVVYKSGIHALGLYTSQFISCGAMVVEYVGEIVGLRVADRREREYQSGKKLQHKSACYFFRIDKEHIIDATRKGGIARFVNHSCEPNCVAKVISVRTEKKVVFFAERDIYPGEEITYDYHFNHEDEGEKIPCYCNSNNCRRFLN